MTDINDIASKHLGRSSDGQLVKPYETPHHIDSDLLVAVPRELNREQYGIKSTDFYGFDTWNCYEFSTLLTNGFPVTGLLRITYASNSPNIVESKSLKLYLNSFNMHGISKSVKVTISKAEKRIKSDLERCIGSAVDVKLHQTQNKKVTDFFSRFETLESTINVTSLNFDEYNENASILERNGVASYDQPKTVRWHTSLLRSNCRVTNQPDWGDVFVNMIGPTVPTPESFLQYIVSMRKENHFHEEICELIYNRLFENFRPELLIVSCLYTRRGGIDINPIRTNNQLSNEYYFDKLGNVNTIIEKTLRQ